MGGKGSGNRHPKRVPYEKNPLMQAKNPREVDPQSNRAAIVFGKALYSLTMEELDLSDAEAVEQRFYDFLDLCDEHGLKPMVTGLAMAFGINRSQLTRIGQGDESVLARKLTAKSRHAVKKAYDFMQVSWEINLQTERGNPVKWLFLGKNYYGMRDQTEQVITRRDEGMALPAPEEVAAKYAAIVGRPEPAAMEEAREPLAIEGDVITVEAEVVPAEGD